MPTRLLTVEAMAKADAMTIAAGTPGFTLMQNAGRAVADAADELLQELEEDSAWGEEEAQVLVVCGRGNNGGDGFIAASALAERGHNVRVMLLCQRDSLKGDAALAAKAWGGEVAACDPKSVGKPVLIIDALLGAGLDRDVKGDFRDMIEAINTAAVNGVPVLAVDLPSGINGDTGAIMGAAVKATETVTFFREKPGHFLMPGRAHCGRVRLAQIGIDESVLGSLDTGVFANAPDLWRAAFPVPRLDSHKYHRGHAVVVSGPIASTGAARLAARGALRAGAGLVTIASPEEALAVNAAASTAVMVKPIGSRQALKHLLSDARHNALVIGPGAGVGVQTQELCLVGLKAGCACVLDADALTSFAGEAELLFQTIAEGKDKRDVILTPHDGEFARLSRDLSALPKLDRARAAAARSGATIVLKGADTVIASPDGRSAINSNARPWLATAGAGDVLAGICAAMLAQGVTGFEAACIAVWMHGEASQEAGPGLIAEDLPEVLPAVFRRLYGEFGVEF
jgi:ADP-dependent NAD(P)H-hydrate dehydratase / NAD(P)H-hydrate epimerase